MVDYSTGGWENIWDIEADLVTIAEMLEFYLCASELATPDIF